jgi:DNA anti-recombination protein RmuC
MRIALHIICAAGLMAAVLFAGGCTDSAFRRESDVRMTRIHDEVQTWAERERGRTQRLEAMEERLQQASVYREKRFHTSMDYIEEGFQKRMDSWPERRQAIKEEVERQLEGHPENIGKTIDEMFD